LQRQSLQVTDIERLVHRLWQVQVSSVSIRESPQRTRVSTLRRVSRRPRFDPTWNARGWQLLSGDETPGGKRDSMSSLEVSYSIGRITVVNPDDPSSTDTSPGPTRVNPLPFPLRLPWLRPDASPVVDKPLPPPASAVISCLPGGPEVRVAVNH